MPLLDLVIQSWSHHILFRLRKYYKKCINALEKCMYWCKDRNTGMKWFNHCNPPPPYFIWLSCHYYVSYVLVLSASFYCTFVYQGKSIIKFKSTFYFLNNAPQAKDRFRYKRSTATADFMYSLPHERPLSSLTAVCNQLQVMAITQDKKSAAMHLGCPLFSSNSQWRKYHTLQNCAATKTTCPKVCSFILSVGTWTVLNPRSAHFPRSHFTLTFNQHVSKYAKAVIRGWFVHPLLFPFC